MLFLRYRVPRNSKRMGLCRNFKISGIGCAARELSGLKTHPLQRELNRELNGFAHVALDFIPRVAGADTAWQIGRIRRVSGFLRYNQKPFSSVKSRLL